MSMEKDNENKEIKEENITEIAPEQSNEVSEVETGAVEKEEETKEEIKVEKETNSVSGKDSFISIVIDQAISLGISAAVLFIADLILRLFGLYIQDKEGMFIILFVVVNIIYNTIMHKAKASSTFGEKLAHLKITK
ncbi:hypothetical protein [Clostridium pasteurianum]|uniref:RDD domain-containing protein n=1 Tax=Clostridium pasteurianum BC1 TaxID=86416 RepID=R4K1Y6_CLOPA|nr:hypothetical protein [Clostridium pasteurianum]AGK97107.1 hypothetical protein Clopa_2232 [Clostridium pasteurianum BC1]